MSKMTEDVQWVECTLGITLTPFQARVTMILGILAGGIHNAPVSWDEVRWVYGNNGVAVPWDHGHIATFDTCKLTLLVYLCCEARIRLQIDAIAVRQLRFGFWQRTDHASTSKGHPTMDEFLADFRAWIPHDHPIYFANHEKGDVDAAALQGPRTDLPGDHPGAAAPTHTEETR